MSIFGKVNTSSSVASTEIDWESTYKDLLPRVYHYFCLRINDSLDAEDLTAITFERAWRNRKKYQKDLGAFTNWIFGIAGHILADYYRKKRSENLRIAENSITELSSRAVEEDFAHKDQFNRIVSILASLPEREREIFSLKYGAQLNNREIAKIMNLTESNIGTILYRIVSRLREQLEK
jgi:RNA polymerase sigma-70 factor (ECF subfamily)